MPEVGKLDEAVVPECTAASPINPDGNFTNPKEYRMSKSNIEPVEVDEYTPTPRWLREVEKLRAKVEVIERYGAILDELSIERQDADGEDQAVLYWQAGWGDSIDLSVIYGTNESKHALTRELVRRIGGRWTKDGYGSSLTLSRTFPTGIRFNLNVSREAVCEKKVIRVEKEIIPASEERVVEREIVEWDCNLVLGDKSSKDES